MGRSIKKKKSTTAAMNRIAVAVREAAIVAAEEGRTTGDPDHFKCFETLVKMLSHLAASIRKAGATYDWGVSYVSHPPKAALPNTTYFHMSIRDPRSKAQQAAHDEWLANDRREQARALVAAQREAKVPS